MEVSSLSNWEYVNLVGHYTRLVQGDTIDKSIYDRGYSPEALAALQDHVTIGGQVKKSLNLKFSNVDDFEYPQLGLVLTLYNQWEKGNRPFLGATAEQPSQIIEIFEVLAQLKAEQEQRSIKEANSGNGKT